MSKYTSSTKAITQAVLELYDRIVDPALLVRRLNLVAAHVVEEASVPSESTVEQLNLFTDYETVRANADREKAELDERLRYVAAHPSECPAVTITYFQADKKKVGGAYVSVTGVVKRINDVEHTLVLTDRTQIPVDDIYNVESDCLYALLPAEDE